jgi:hypothetical protein
MKELARMRDEISAEDGEQRRATAGRCQRITEGSSQCSLRPEDRRG